MIPTPEQIDGFERAMEYVTLMVVGNTDAAADVIKAAFQDSATAVSFVVGMSNFVVGMNGILAQVSNKTPEQHWEFFAQQLQIHRPPEWER